MLPMHATTVAQVFPHHLNFQELLQLAQQQPPAPVMQPALGQLGGGHDVLPQHATAQSLGLTMSMPPGIRGAANRIGEGDGIRQHFSTIILADSWPGAHRSPATALPQETSSYTAGQPFYHATDVYAPHPFSAAGGPLPTAYADFTRVSLHGRAPASPEQQAPRPEDAGVHTPQPHHM